MSLAPRAVVVHRRSELDLLLQRHGSRGQAEFFLRSRGRDLASVQQHHDAQEQALRQVATSIPGHWRRLAVERADLPRTRFDPEDVVVAVGQDGLVANIAKYLADQPVVGVDPEPGRGYGVLVRHRADAAAAVLTAVEAGTAGLEFRAMAEAVLDDGQRMRALNELYAGDPGHQSARYRLRAGPAAGHDREAGFERQSSSGILVGTGTGATGWCSSLARDRSDPPRLPGALQQQLAWFVREAWPSPSTGRTLVAGLLEPGQELEMIAEGDLVVFGDGLEGDRLRLGWGQRLVLRPAGTRLRLVLGSAGDRGLRTSGTPIGSVPAGGGPAVASRS